jgi:hypothetical protein
LALLLFVVPAAVSAQGVRVNGTTSMQAVDLRPLVEDSVAVAATTGTGPYRAMADGRLVRCVEGEAFCRFRGSGERELFAPVVQDLRAVAWGFGEGISLQTHLRGRTSVGSTPSWPRADDAFDAIEAWLEIDRGPARARLGRQWTTGGLGLRNYDGASLLVRQGRARIEAFAGRSLVSGLNEPVDGGLIGALDDLPPDEAGWLFGARGSAAIGTRGAVAAEWQRVIRADRAALYSDRISGDANTRLFGTVIDASLTWDLGERQANNASLEISRSLALGIAVSAQARRHRPFFDAWTIWGAFSPVAFDELRAGAGWRHPTGVLGVDVRAAWREYDETEEGLESDPLKGSGWRAGVGLDWVPRESWFLYGDYDIDIGFGASRSDVVAGARWMPDESRFVGLAVSGLQHIYEFRVGTGRVAGVRVEAGTPLGSVTRLVADGAVYLHRSVGAFPDWSQRRLSIRLEWTAGDDPGARAQR